MHNSSTRRFNPITMLGNLTPLFSAFFTECRAVISKLAIEGERVFAIIRIPAEAAFSVVAEILSILKQACAQKASFQFGVQHDFSLSEDECKVDIIGLTLM